MKLFSLQVGLGDREGDMNLDRIIPAGTAGLGRTGGKWLNLFCARYPTSIRCKNLAGLGGIGGYRPSAYYCARYPTSIQCKNLAGLGGTGGYRLNALCARYPKSMRCKNLPGLL